MYSPQPNGGGDSLSPTAAIQRKQKIFFNNSLENPQTVTSSTLKDTYRLNKTLFVEKPINASPKHVSLSSEKEPRTKETPPESAEQCPELKELDGYVGFANLPNQVYRKAVKRGFEFTLMVVGEAGLGKSTFINSMFLTDIYNSTDYPGPTFRIKKTVTVQTTKVLLKENGVNLLLTVVDVPGFGDAVDNSACWTPVIEFIEHKYEDYLNSEARVTRKSKSDQRVHCCLYFIRPSGFKTLDLEFMKRLCNKVNIIPIIAKADTLTTDELALLKKQILNEITENKIKIYEFPDDEDEEHKCLKDRMPFAVVGANTVFEKGDNKVRGRKYPWGLVEVENLDHCDFIALRNLLIRTHLQDLKDVTNNVHYENYRISKLADLSADGKLSKVLNKTPLTHLEEEKQEHDLKIQKMKVEMEKVFEMKVREKEQKLKDTEEELLKRYETNKKTLQMQAKELEAKRRLFEAEQNEWLRETEVTATLKDLKTRSLEGRRKTLNGKKENKKKGLFKQWTASSTDGEV